MARLTITLSDHLHTALKQTAASQGKTIRQIIEEGLLLRGVKTREDASEIVARARQASHLEDDEAMKLALEETAAERGR